MNHFEIRLIDSNFFNKWQTERHYLKRPIIRSKLLAHGIFVDKNMVGGLLWATPHFTKKRGLFGFPNTLDKWEVLMLARFYLVDDNNVIASEALGASIGKGRNRGSHRRGWRVQEDWVLENPPRFPDKPFVPRLLISWSDTKWGHKGTIYKASGWEQWDKTSVNYRRTDKAHDREMWTPDANDGDKTCWIMRLSANPRAESIGRNVPRQINML